MNPSRHRKRVAALAVTLLVAAACSSPQGTEQAENSLLGKGKDRGAGNSNGGGKAGGGRKNGGGRPGGAKKAGGQAIPSAPGAVAPSPGEGTKAFDPSTKTKTDVTGQGEDPAAATVLVTEPDPDAEKSGVTPEYGDILSTEVAGTARNVRVTITLHADLPDKMPDDKTYMVLGFGLTPPKGQQQGYAFGASADSKGWTAYGGNKEEGGKFPGDFSISGDTAVFTIPWSAIKGPRPFEWYAQTSWFRSLAGTTHYSLDALPNDGPAKYPAG